MANEELLTLDGLVLNDATFGLAELVSPQPRERPEWIGAADSEAQLLSRTPKHENRDVTVKIQVAPQASMDTALDKIGLLVDKCVKASRYTDGIGMTWTPATSTRTVTFDVLSAEITDMPIDWESGWLALAPTVTIVMKAKPYLRGVETLTSTTSSSTPFVTATVTGTGDVTNLGRLIVTDTATQSRRHVEWGLEGPLTYNAATSLLIDSDDMVTTGFAGAQTTATGSYDPNAAGNNVVAASIYPFTTAIAGTGVLAHVGAFRVKARLKCTTPSAWVRLVWQIGDGSFASNSYAKLPGATNWYEVDLGVITIPPVIVGTQKWSGRLEAYTTSSSAETLTLDYLTLVPVQNGYGKARTGFGVGAGVMAGYDNFTGTTAAGALNARVAPAGGTWATSGVAGDFLFADDLSGEQVKRDTVDAAFVRRTAILGSTTYGDVDTSVRFYVADGTISNLHVLHARWTDVNNYLEATMQTGAGAGRDTLTLASHAGGATGVFTTADIPAVTPGWYKLRLLAWVTTGHAIAVLSTDNAVPIAQIEASHTDLKTAGTLATGKVGIADAANAAIARYYDDFYVGSPPAEPTVIFSGRNMQVRYDDTLRQDSTGTYTGRPPIYRGSRFLVPVGTSRVLVKVRRNDIEISEDSAVTDATQVQIGITPRYLAVPR